MGDKMHKKFIFCLFSLLIIITIISFSTVQAATSNTNSQTSYNNNINSHRFDYINQKNNNDEIILKYVFIGLFLLPIVYAIVRFIYHFITYKEPNDDHITDEEFNKQCPEFDLNALRKEFGEIFINVQRARMNLDYSGLRQLVDTELYNLYKVDFDVMSSKLQKNVMSDFNIVSLYFYDYQKTDSFTMIGVDFTICFRDYIVDNNKTVIRGKGKILYQKRYKLGFVKYDDKNKWILKIKQKVRQTNLT